MLLYPIIIFRLKVNNEMGKKEFNFRIQVSRQNATNNRLGRDNAIIRRKKAIKNCS
jgi:hypothetical protein